MHDRMFLGLAAALYLFSSSVQSRVDREMPSDMASIAQDGIGEMKGYALLGVSYSQGLGVIGSIIITNSPQVFLSLSYLLLNSALTRQLAADEIIRFLAEKKPLRVSSPQGCKDLAMHSPSRCATPYL